MSSSIGSRCAAPDTKLTRLEKEIDDVEDAREIRMYLRHEAGHAFNYALQVVREAGLARAVRALHK